DTGIPVSNIEAATMCNVEATLHRRLGVGLHDAAIPVLRNGRQVGAEGPLRFPGRSDRLRPCDGGKGQAGHGDGNADLLHDETLLSCHDEYCPRHRKGRANFYVSKETLTRQSCSVLGRNVKLAAQRWGSMHGVKPSIRGGIARPRQCAALLSACTPACLPRFARRAARDAQRAPTTTSAVWLVSVAQHQLAPSRRDVSRSRRSD